MKTAIYIEDGVVQLVLTPESEFETNAIGSFSKQPVEVQIFDGTFYDCRGGWTRQSSYYVDHWNPDSRDKSLILRVGRKIEQGTP